MTEISNIALISSNGDKNIAEIVTKAVTSVGENGTIMVENSSTDKTRLKLWKGFLLIVDIFLLILSTILKTDLHVE